LYFFLLRITGSAETAEDILQDTFLKLWMHRDKLTSINNFSGYLYRMIRNSAITGFQRLSLQTLMLADMKREAEATGRPIDEALIEKQLHEMLTHVINELPERQRQVYNMVRVEGLKYEEVAQALNISLSTVKNHMTRALETIRTQIGSRYIITGFYLLILIGILRK
jgi:RNA polymerase sigma-70 factor (ECF subfamily)